MEKQYFTFYDRTNSFTIDDFGNIGRTMTDGTINSNEIGTNTDTKTIMRCRENMYILHSGSRPYEVYYFCNNIIKIYGQSLKEVNFI